MLHYKCCEPESEKISTFEENKKHVTGEEFFSSFANISKTTRDQK